MSRLWNSGRVQGRRKQPARKRAQLARHLEFALPVELTPEQNRALALGAGREFVSRGMVAQLSVHEPESD